MKVNNQFDFDDIALRKIGKAMGKRSGKAKRAEVRVWLNTLVGGAVQRLEMPVMRRRRVPEDEADKRATAALRQLAGEADAMCVCGRPHMDHIGVRFDCPLSKSVKPGSRFKAVTTVIQRVCQFCAADMGTKDGKGMTGTSHGTCPACAQLTDDEQRAVYLRRKVVTHG